MRACARPVAASAVVRKSLRIACGLAGMLAGLARDAGAQTDTLLAEAAVQLDIHNGPSEIVAALVYDGTMLLPVHRFLQMSEFRVTAFALGDSVSAVLEPRSIPLSIHPDRGELRLGDSVLPIGPADARWWDGDLFASAAILERVFGVAVRIEWMDLTVFVGQTAALPVVRRARRERQQALFRLPQLPEGLRLFPERPTADGAVFNWALTGSTGARDDYYTLDLGVGAQVLGGGLSLRPQVWRIAGLTGSELRASWERAWPDNGWLRQVRVGDVQSNGRRAQILRGGVVTNAPFIRSSEFDVEQIVGSLPVGWEVELYDGGRLIGYGDVDQLGQFRVPLEVRYGQNPFELVLYGPAGEVMTQRRTVRVPFSRLPDGQFEYALAAGQCRYAPCDAMWSTDLRYGISRRVTVQAGWDLYGKRTGGILWQPYAVASAGVLRGVNVTGEAVFNGLIRGTVEYEPSPDLRVSASHAFFDDAGTGFTTAFAENERTEANFLWRPGLMDRSLYLQGFAARSVSSSYVRMFARSSATAQLGRVRYTAGIRYDEVGPVESSSGRLYADLGADAVVTGPAAWMRGTSLRGEVSFRATGGLSSVAATVGRAIGRVARADMSVGWIEFGGYALSFAVTTMLPGPRAGVRTQSSTTTGTTGLMFVNGSVVYDPDRGDVRWTDGGDLGRAGVTGLLFLDQNDNGVRDPDEAGITGIPVQVGGWHVETDPAGRFEAWDLFPFEPVDIVVDSLAFEDPRLVAPAPVLHVQPTPNSYVNVDIPVVVGAELLGHVVLDGDAVPGLPVILRNLVTGVEVRTGTFSDGGFYRAGVPPGEYEVVLPDAVMEELRLYAAPLHLFVPPGSGDKRFDNLVIELRRLPE